MALVDVLAEGRLAHLVLRRPERRNALNAALIEQLYRAACQVEHDPEIDCVVVRGDGPGFSAGIDATALTQLSSAGALREVQGAFVQAFDRLHKMAKPTIAQVHGWAIGAGFELALACDLRVIAADAVLGLPETRMGVVPDVGACSRLTALVGAGRAKELIMTSAMISGIRAAELGIANRVAEAPSLGDVTAGLVEELLACSAHANGLVKSIIDQAAMPDEAAVAAAELTAQLSCVTTEWFRSSAASFEARPGGKTATA